MMNVGEYKLVKNAVVNLDPALLDYLREKKLAYRIMVFLEQNKLNDNEGWVKVPDICKEIENYTLAKKMTPPKNISSSVHYVCKRLLEPYGAIEKASSSRPIYYRINEKGKKHINYLNRKRLG